MNSLIEAFKEAVRVVLISIIPLAIIQLQDGTIDTRVISITAAIAFLRFIDKWMHEWGKKNESKLISKGLTRF